MSAVSRIQKEDKTMSVVSRVQKQDETNGS